MKIRFIAIVIKNNQKGKFGTLSIPFRGIDSVPVDTTLLLN
jgi:hypothetical protein